jgi:hypothetical protein
MMFEIEVRVKDVLKLKVLQVAAQVKKSRGILQG